MRAHENPFRSQQILRVRYQPQAESWDQITARLRDLRYRAAILGAEGSGKTTLLEDLQPRVADQGLRGVLVLHHAARPRPDWQQLASLGEREVLLLDGADLLNTAQWWRLRWISRRFGGMVVTSHTRAMLPVLMRCQTSPQLLAQIIQQLVPPDDRPQASNLASELFVRHHGNLRDALREMYDRYAEMPQPSARPPSSPMICPVM